MSSKPRRRPRWEPKPPPGLRPKLTRGQVLDLGLCHLANVDAIARGEGTPEILWQHCGGALTWLTAATLMEQRYPGRFGEAQRVMEAAVAGCRDLANRYRRTGRVVFTALELQMARLSVEWMDALAEVVEKDIALIAADASEAIVNQWADAEQAAA